MSSTFKGVEISDATGIKYFTEINVKQDLDIVSPISSVIPLGSKYPYHTKYGVAHYYTGTVTAAFENNQSNKCKCEAYAYGDTEYRIKFVEWLQNGLTKYLKLSESFILPVTIIGNIKISAENTIDDTIINTSFSWEQCGDAIEDNNNSICEYCGVEYVFGTKFCSNCGKAVQ